MSERQGASRLVLPALVGLGLLSAVCPLHAQDAERGRAVYDKWCAQCHGETGKGDGPAAASMIPRPRDFTTALYQIRSTASGELPTDADILRAIDEGLPGTAMPGWRDQLSLADRRALVDYLKTFSAFFAGDAPQPLDFSRARGGGPEALRIGRQMYDSIECHKCHGERGRGDGPSAPTLEDDADQPIYAADLTERWRFNGGGTVEDIYRRLRTGLDGTPMPSMSDLLAANFMTDDELWHLARYVHSLSPDASPPPVRDVVRAARAAGALPTAPADSAWAEVERYWIPLVGQVVRRPRWFAPAVSGLWVQGLHDGERVALRVTWSDRSQSPDTAWNQFTARVLAALAGDDSLPPRLEPWPDRLAVQFPRVIPGGMERPHFLMGSAAEPVYQWRWASVGGAAAGLARGLERFDPLPGGTPDAQAAYAAGEWQVVFTRALATGDTANELQFQPGRAIPVAFFAWDGSNGERGSRMAMSSWYFLALDQPTPPRVFVLPVAAAVLTLGLGLAAVRRAQRAR